MYLSHMSDSYSPSGNQPVTWIGGQPIYAAHFLAIGFVATMLVTTILAALNLNAALLAHSRAPACSMARSGGSSPTAW